MFVKISHESSDWTRWRCCERKVKFANHKTAKRARDKMSERRGGSFEAYKCHFCGSWHIGHALSEGAR